MFVHRVSLTTCAHDFFLGRRAILRIHSRQMKEAGGLDPEAQEWIEDLGDEGLAAKTDYYSGAELAGLVRSAASFALGRTIDESGDAEGMVRREDFEKGLTEVRPALGRQDELLKLRYPLGISCYSVCVERVMRDLERFTRPVVQKSPRIQSLLLVGAGGKGGAGVTGLSAWAASKTSDNGVTDYVRFITALDLISASEGGNEGARAAALAENFQEAREMAHALIVFDDIDQLCAGTGRGGYSSIMIAALRALLRSPPATDSASKAGGSIDSKLSGGAKTLHVIATTSRSDAACVILYELFDETIGTLVIIVVRLCVTSLCVFDANSIIHKVVPLLSDARQAARLLQEANGLSELIIDHEMMGQAIITQLGSVGVKTALRIAERTVADAMNGMEEDPRTAQGRALEQILGDLTLDGAVAQELCEVIL